MYIASVIADLHLDDWAKWANKTAQGRNSRMDAQLFAIKTMLTLNPEPNKTLIIAGDTANPRKESLPLAVSNGITDLVNWCSATMQQTYVIEGNHDYPWHKPMDGQLSSVSIAKRDNVHVIEGTRIVKVPLPNNSESLYLCML